MQRLCFTRTEDGGILITTDEPVRLVIPASAIEMVRKRFSGDAPEGFAGFLDTLGKVFNVTEQIKNNPMVRHVIKTYVPMGDQALKVTDAAMMAAQWGKKQLANKPRVQALVQDFRRNVPQARAEVGRIRRDAANGNPAALAALRDVNLIGAVMRDMQALGSMSKHFGIDINSGAAFGAEEVPQWD